MKRSDDTDSHAHRGAFRFRLRLACGIIKALFTTSPTKSATVKVTDDGSLIIKTHPSSE